jgi:hypothetical protein
MKRPPPQATGVKDDSVSVALGYPLWGDPVQRHALGRSLKGTPPPPNRICLNSQDHLLSGEPLVARPTSPGPCDRPSRQGRRARARSYSVRL